MTNRTNGSVVRQFEQEFAQYVGAKYAIACCNGTATLHTALVALGVKPGDRVAVPPLTMASTTLAVLHAGAVPVFVDVDPNTWVMEPQRTNLRLVYDVGVDLYGLTPIYPGRWRVADSAQTINPHQGWQGVAFTSYSFQASKIISCGEGGMLVTDDGNLGYRAWKFSRLGYEVEPHDSLGGITKLKHPQGVRHWMIGYNYRMSDAQAFFALRQLAHAGELLERRRYAAECYRQAIAGCDWITPQYVPDGWPHSYWTYAIALQHRDLWEPFVKALVAAGGERPYAAWRITYQEPAFRHLAPDGTCPIAEDLQPRLVQLQTNHKDAAESERAAECVADAVRSVSVHELVYRIDYPQI